MCPDCERNLETDEDRKRQIRKLVKSALGETPRVINIELPGVCPYNLLCKSQSWLYSLKYHTDFMQKMLEESDWGCMGGKAMIGCSMYNIWKKREKDDEK